MNPSDLKVKCGEWKLGIDDEPKPFQITGVRSVSFHPSYNPANLNNDVALLHCDERIRYDSHVGPICLEDQYASGSSDDCVTTGWGKEVLRSEYWFFLNESQWEFELQLTFVFSAIFSQST